MLETVWGISDDLDVTQAVDSVIEQCRSRLQGRRPQAGVLFTSCMDADFHALLATICDAFSGIELVGCTTDGEITPSLEASEDAVSLLLFCSETIAFKAALVPEISDLGTASFERIYSSCVKDMGGEPSLCFIFPDGLTTFDTGLDEILHQVCGDNVLIAGGAAGDHYRFSRTYQFCGRDVASNGMAMLLFRGDMQVAVGIGNGWKPFGHYYRIDGFEKNRVYSIDDMTARQFYSVHLGTVEPVITHIPLAVYREQGGDFLLRDPVSVTHDDGSIEFVGTFPKNSLVRLTTVFREDIICSADRANEAVMDSCEGKPDLVMVFSCSSRRHILGSRSGEELGVLTGSAGIPFFGFYSYGEYAPCRGEEPVRLQNDCYVVLGIRESEG